MVVVTNSQMKQIEENSFKIFNEHETTDGKRGKRRRDVHSADYGGGREVLYRLLRPWQQWRRRLGSGQKAL